MGRTLKAKLFGLMAGLVAMMYTASAMAQVANLFTPVSGDKSIALILQPIFGSDLFSATGIASGGAGGSTPFEVAMGILNGIALLVGGFLTFYMLVVGTMMTAHDGENMGRKWSSVWVPIRTAIGTAMVVPVAGGVGTGYCAAQLLMGWLVTQGIGAADQLWSGYASSTFSAQGMAPTSVLPQVAPLAMGILKSEVCMATINNLRKNDSASQALWPTDFAASNLSQGGSVTGRQYGSGLAECGKVTYMLTSDTATALSSTDYGFNNALGTVLIDQGAVQTAHIQAVSVLESQLQPIAQSIVVNGPSGATGAQFAQAVVAYQQAVATAVGSSAASQSAFSAIQQSASQDGWALAGAFFMKASSLQDQMNAMVTSVPATSAPTSFGGSTESVLAAQYAALEQFKSQSSTQSLGIAQQNSRDDDSGNILQRVLAEFSEGGMQLMRHVIQPNPDRNGIMSIKDVGGATMGAAEAIVLAITTTKAADSSLWGQVANLAVGTHGIADVVTEVMMMLAVPMFLLGATMAIYIPMLPFMIYFGTVLGWVILVAEAIIAAPLWGIMHLNPNGDEMAGAARQGYMMILGLMLRPALIVLGFIFASLAVDPLIKMFESIFFPVFAASMKGSFVGVGTMLVMCFIFTSSMMMLINRVFGFIHVIPDQLLRWIGGGTEQLGSYGGGMGEGSKAALGMAAAKMSGGAANLTGALDRGKQAALTRGAQQEDRAMQQKQLQGQQNERADRANGAADAAAGTTARADSTGSAADHLDAMRDHQTAQKGFAAVALDHKVDGKADDEQPMEYKNAASNAAESANEANHHYSALQNVARASASFARATGTKEAYQAAASDAAIGAQASSMMGMHAGSAAGAAQAKGVKTEMNQLQQEMSALAASAPSQVEMSATNAKSISGPSASVQASSPGGPTTGAAPGANDSEVFGKS